jgi:hypothetical protein
MKVICFMCRRERDKSRCQVYTLTDTEKAFLKNKGEEVVDEVAYCRPCFGLLKDPRTATDLMKGVAQIQLRSVGAANAEQLSESFRRNLLSKMKAKPAS